MDRRTTAAERKHAVAEAIAQQRLEGLEVSQSVVAQMDRWIDGSATIDEIAASVTERVRRGEILD